MSIISIHYKNNDISISSHGEVIYNHGSYLNFYWLSEAQREFIKNNIPSTEYDTVIKSHVNNNYTSSNIHKYFHSWCKQESTKVIITKMDTGCPVFVAYDKDGDLLKVQCCVEFNSDTGFPAYDSTKSYIIDNILKSEELTQDDIKLLKNVKSFWDYLNSCNDIAYNILQGAYNA